jgi:hypothetical protein
VKRSEHDRWLEATLADIWLLQRDYWEWSLNALALEAELAPTTVWKLFHGHTKDCRVSTVRKLARAVGLKLEWVDVKGYKKTVLRRQRRRAA